MKKKNLLTDEDKLKADRLKTVWNEKKKLLGLSQEVAAGKLGFSTQAAISQFLNGKIPLNIENVLKFAELLEVPPETIDPAIASLLHPVRIAERDKNQFKINEVNKYPLYDVEQILRLVKLGYVGHTEQYVTTAHQASERSFWLKVSGHSMTAPQGVKPSFPEGVLILVDPTEKVTAGNFCVSALSNYDELTFKKYDRDAGESYLVPLNPAYRTLKCDHSVQIIGKVVHAIWADTVFNSTPK